MGERGTAPSLCFLPSPSFPPVPALYPRAHPLARSRLGLVAESEIGLRFSERTFCGTAKRRRQKGPVITGPKTRQRCFRGGPQSYCEPAPAAKGKMAAAGMGPNQEATSTPETPASRSSPRDAPARDRYSNAAVPAQKEKKNPNQPQIAPPPPSLGYPTPPGENLGERLQMNRA